MKRIILQPEHIIVPEHEVGNEGILQIYFRVFDRGHGEDLPPAIITHKNNINPSYMRNKFVAKRRADEFYRKLMDLEAEYLLLDGNHKTTATTLCHVAPSVLELETNQDLGEARKMVERGELFNFPHEEERLSDIADSFIGFLFEKKYVRTLRQRVDELTSNGDLPKYMKERYERRVLED